MRATRPLFLGLDLGTQALRAALFDLEGNCRGFATTSLETFHPRSGWAEQNASQWWQGLRTAIPEALAKADAKPDEVAGIGFDCTSCTVLPCKLDGVPLRRAILWMDQRAFREAEEVSATGDASLRYVSGVVSPEWMLPKALWLKRHEPNIFGQAGRLVECADWLMFKLTGEWTLSLNNVTVKWNYARPDGGWSSGLLQKTGLHELLGKWPSLVVPLGKGDLWLSAMAAKELGLRPGIPVARGGIDAYLGMLGMGAVGPGDVAMVIGSSTCHLAMSDKALFGSGMMGCYPDAVVEGLYTLEGGQTATGSIINWFRRHFAAAETAEAERTGRNVYELLDGKADAVPPGSEGLVCLDYWQGNRSPLKDARARGTLWGLTLSHGTGHVVRSIYEGTAFGSRLILEDLENHGFRVGRLFASGGGAKSWVWLQIKADVLGRPIHLARESEACALGSALVAAVHCRHYDTLAEAAERMVHHASIVKPRSRNKPVYDYYYEKYVETYRALKPLMHDLADRRPG